MNLQPCPEIRLDDTDWVDEITPHSNYACTQLVIDGGNLQDKLILQISTMQTDKYQGKNLISIIKDEEITHRMFDDMKLKFGIFGKKTR